MNEQIPYFFGQIVAFAAVGLFAYNFIQGRKLYNPEDDADLFTIGYIQHPNQVAVNAKVTVKEDNFQDKQLYKDCRDSLVALGIKKSQAKKITKDFFRNKEPEDLQSFLKVALSSQH
tara:strand:- start:204 stop:554 length:351 start_codon:yes stop_codon:yes gene_type:complete